MKPLIVGQAPGPTPSDPDEPLAGRSGQRLSDLCGLELPEFLRRFDRVNLLDHFPGKNGKGDSFPIAPARQKAAEIIAAPETPGRRIILLGSVAPVLFGLTPRSFLAFAPHERALFACCPHPSAINRWWNDPGNVERARAFWTALSNDTAPALSSARGESKRRSFPDPKSRANLRK